MVLTANRDVDHYIDQELRTVAVAASKKIFKGSFVGLDSSGYARPLIAGDRFVGLAYEEKDNSSGSNGDLSGRISTIGDFGHALAGATVADLGRPVFASADDTLTFTATGNSYVGIVQDVASSGTIILRLDANRKMVSTIVHAVDNLAAGADIAARAVHTFDGEGWIVAARVVNQASASAGIDASNTCVVTLATGAGTVVTKTFNDSVTFPAANTADDLGALSNAHAAAGAVLTLAVTNGTTADPGPFLVEVDYV